MRAACVRLLLAALTSTVSGDRGEPHNASKRHSSPSSSPPRNFCSGSHGKADASSPSSSSSQQQQQQQQGHNKALLHVAQFGEVFRSCVTSLGTALNFCRNVTADPSEQQRAWDSVQAHVVVPAERRGWSVAVFADIVLHPMSASEAAATRLERVRRTICGRLRPVAVRVSSWRSHATVQTEWAAVLERFTAGPRWQAVLLLRGDLVFKRPVEIPLPPPPTGESALQSHQHPVLLPFAMCHAKCSPPLQEPPSPRACDMLVYVPRSRLPHVLGALRGHSNCPNKIGMHNLAHWLGTGNGGVRFLLEERYESNSERQWNPLYRIAGRPEAGEDTRACTGGMQIPCWSRAAAEEEDAVCGGRMADVHWNRGKVRAPACFNAHHMTACPPPPPPPPPGRVVVHTEY